MNAEVLQVLLLALFGGAIIGVYYVYNLLVRKWLGIEPWGEPLPAVMRWTMFLGAISTVLFVVWAVVSVLGRHWVL